MQWKNTRNLESVYVSASSMVIFCHFNRLSRLYEQQTSFVCDVILHFSAYASDAVAARAPVVALLRAVRLRAVRVRAVRVRAAVRRHRPAHAYAAAVNAVLKHPAASHKTTQVRAAAVVAKDTCFIQHLTTH